MPPSPDETSAARLRDRVAADPGLRAAVAAARAWGVSPRRFLGWEPITVNTPIYGITGTVAHTRVETEPEWDDEGRDLVLAFLDWESQLCPGCRQPLAETTDPANEGRYVPRPAIRCHRCTASSQASDAYKDAPHVHALFIPLTSPGEISTDEGHLDTP